MSDFEDHAYGAPLPGEREWRASATAGADSSAGRAQLRWLAFDSGSSAQAVLDADGRFVDVNQKMVSLLRTDRASLVGRSAGEYVDVLAAERLRRAVPSAGTIHVVGRRLDGPRVGTSFDITALSIDSARVGYAVMVGSGSDAHDAEQRLSVQDSFYQEVSRRAWDLALVTDVDARLLFVSANVEAILGYFPDEVLAGCGLDFVHPDDRAIGEDVLRRVIEDPSGPARALLRIRDANGCWRWMEETASNFLDDPAIGGIVANLRDVTENVATQQDLERSESRHRAILDAASEGIFATDEQGTVIFANQRVAELIGLSLEEIYETPLWSLIDPEWAAALDQRIARRADLGVERYEVDWVNVVGQHRVLRVSSTPLEHEGSVASLATIMDVTAQREAEEQLRRRALYDPLTGLPNRRLLDERLASVTSRARHDDATITAPTTAMIYLDLDDLKAVNDRAGHPAGDRLLAEMARRLRDSVREVDTVARLGGDEFAVLCENVTPEEADAIVDRIKRRLSAPLTIDCHQLAPSVSIGVALCPPHPVEDVLRLADMAMYRAKQSGRGQYVIFDEKMAREATRRDTLRSEVSDVIEGYGLVVLYQPIVEIETGRVRGMEALSRWSHPKLGMIGAGELLAAVSSAGLQAAFDDALLQRACAELAKLIHTHQVPGETYVSVNVGFDDLRGRPLDERVMEVLAASGLRPENLIIEVTESAMMTDMASSITRLQRLSDMGVRIAVDDFGTGYSSLAYLQKLPVHIVKIDRSFVADLPDEGNSGVIIKSITALARALGLNIIAEGVETPGQARALVTMGCRRAQGFLWSRPVPLAELNLDLHRLL